MLGNGYVDYCRHTKLSGIIINKKMATYSSNNVSKAFTQPKSAPVASYQKAFSYVPPKITGQVASYNAPVPNTLSAVKQGAATAQATNIAPIQQSISSRSSGGSNPAIALAALVQKNTAIPTTTPTVVKPLGTSTGGITYNASGAYTPVAKVPTLNVGGDISNTFNAGLPGTTPEGFVYDVNTKTYVPKQSDTETEVQKALRDFQNLERPNAEQIYRESGQREVEKRREEVNRIASQINAISTKAQADQLSLIGQGRGIPEPIIGGQQAQIAREAAIQALPLQALLANAQGNLELAQQHLDTTFKLKLEDATNLFNYQKDLVKYALEVADKKQQREIEKIQKQDDRNFTLTRDAINYAQSLSMEAIKNGQANVAVQLGQLDHNSPTYSQDVARLAGQIAKQTVIHPSVSGAYSGALNVILGSTKFTADQKKSVVNSINNGEDPFQVVKNQAKGILPSPVATDISKAETSKEQIDRINTLLNDYYAKGGKTSIFSGNYESVINKLGEVSNPKLVSIATNIALAMQAYRLAVTGTAASIQEDSRIDSVFPGINKSEGLNKIKTKSLIDYFETTIDSGYRQALGSTYDELKKLNTQIKPQDISVVSNEELLSSVPENNALQINNLDFFNSIKSINPQ